MRRRRFYYEATSAGWVFLGVGIFVFVAALNSQSNLLFFAFGLLLGAWVLSGGMAAALCWPWHVLDRLRRAGSGAPQAVDLLPGVLQAVLMELCRLLDPLGTLLLRKVEVVRLLSDHCAAGESLEVHYRLTNGKRRWPCFALRISEARVGGELTVAPAAFCLHLPGGQSATAMTTLRPRARGILELHAVRIVSSFPFGFVERALQVAQPARIVVYPRVGLLRREVALRCREGASATASTSEVRGGAEEFYGLREYRAGDNVKAIHWRRTAHTGELMIREMTSNSSPQMVVVLNLREWRRNAQGLAEVERAVELATALVCYGFLENDAVGLWIPGSGQAELAQPRVGRDARAHVLEALARVRAETLDCGPTLVPQVRGGTRAEWVIVTLAATDKIADAAPEKATRTVFALDYPESGSWVSFDEHNPARQETGEARGQETKHA